ncbi:hypothetical protein [Microbacterium capsulatum]|uniref:RDD domain-containing protein n=1 Tax=Microbacterium capsulatum TaxID=3041921 RepID=A0ABU0XIN1_9MICO|nr:hypothetical protein [Microbacterium sp. ASV81]MDQ4214991.1 hypothetical protein [Microbacterium sp. ASV81]
MASDWRVLGVLGIDLLVMVPGIVFVAIWRVHFDATRAALLTAAIVWPVFAFCYGVCSAGGRSLGGLAFGTRLVLVPSGRSLGPWCRGWLAFLLGVLLVLLVASEMGPWGRARRADPEEQFTGKTRFIDVAASRGLDPVGSPQPRIE